MVLYIDNKMENFAPPIGPLPQKFSLTMYSNSELLYYHCSSIKVQGGVIAEQLYLLYCKYYV